MARVRPRHYPLRFHLRALLWQLVAAGGGLDRFRRIDGTRVTRLIFVCKGNVCRSPYAEARAADAGWCTLSAGLRTCGGIRANRRARAVARVRGVALQGHRSRAVQDLDLSEGDLLVAMEPAQALELRRIAERSGAQVTVLGLWSEEPRALIHDPFGRSPRLFCDCFAQIDAGVAGLLAALSQPERVPLSESG